MEGVTREEVLRSKADVLGIKADVLAWCEEELIVSTTYRVWRGRLSIALGVGKVFRIFGGVNDLILEFHESLDCKDWRWDAAYHLLGLEAVHHARLERERVKPLLDCIDNSAFMYKLYIDGDLGNSTNRFNFAESFGKLKRAGTAYKNDNPREDGL